MAYAKHNFKNGNVLYAEQMNEMDDQIFQNSVAADKVVLATTADVVEVLNTEPNSSETSGS